MLLWDSIRHYSVFLRSRLDLDLDLEFKSFGLSILSSKERVSRILNSRVTYTYTYTAVPADKILDIRYLYIYYIITLLYYYLFYC